MPGSSALEVVEGQSGSVLEVVEGKSGSVLGLELDEIQAESESGQVVVVGELLHVVGR